MRRIEGPTPGPMSASATAMLGYEQVELELSGDAVTFPLVGERRVDGRWETGAGTNAAFTTRLVVRLPADRTAFSGTVVVEWLNVSGGGDMATDWIHLHRHLQRCGHAWVGVSAQEVGVHGGGILEGQHLTKLDPARYGHLVHPGDSYSYDIFSTACNEIRRWLAEELLFTDPIRLIATGHSQSAAFLATYVNAVDQQARSIDAFLIHGWGGRGAELDGFFVGGAGTDHALAQRRVSENPNLLRSDLRCPTLLVQSESDRSLFDPARPYEPDTDRLRVWEIAGASHADSYMFGGNRDDGTLSDAELLELLRTSSFRSDMSRSTMAGMAARMLWQQVRKGGLAAVKQMAKASAAMRSSGGGLNTGPQQHYVMQAACAALEAWLESGVVPVSSSRFEVAADGQLARDAQGFVIGGIRTPWVDSPLELLSGQGGPMGVTRALEDNELARRFPGGSEDYLQQFTDHLDQTILAGHLLAEDRAEALAMAKVASKQLTGTGK